jgi:hypothetical protein
LSFFNKLCHSQNNKPCHSDRSRNERDGVVEEPAVSRSVYASQSGEAGLGRRTGGVAVEQLSFLSIDEAGPGRVNEGWTKISFRDRVA